MEGKKIRFLEKTVLGRDTKFNDADAVIDRCIKRAYLDMLSAGRYYLSGGMELRCGGLRRIFEKSGYRYSREHIDAASALFGEKEEIRKNSSYATRYGLAQKFVNMSYKYFYVFDTYIGREIDYSECDCPLDSAILKELPQIKTAWSKLTRGEYERCQEEISGLLRRKGLQTEARELGNLAFDFYFW